MSDRSDLDDLVAVSDESDERLSEQLEALRAEKRESVRMTEVLNGVNDLIHSSLDSDRIMQMVVERAVEAFGVDAAFVLLREGDRLRIGYASGFPDESLEFSLPVVECPAFERVVVTRHPLVFNDLATAGVDGPRFATILGAASALYVPLIVRGEGIGILSLCYLERMRDFSRTQIDHARKLATSIGLALENARLYKTEHDIAQVLQRALIDVRTSIPHLEIAYVYRSADAMTGSVGGDFCDIFEIDAARVGILVGDVSGKGIGAAVLTSLLKNSIGAYAMDGAGPASSLEKSNRIAAARTAAWIFATVFLAILDRSTGELRYAGAGHPPLLVRRHDNGVEQFPSGGPILGAFETARFTEGMTVLVPGDTIVLYTDGITEARRGAELYGGDRLLEAIASGDPRPRKLINAVVEDVTAFARGNLNDDAVMLAVRYAPE